MKLWPPKPDHERPDNSPDRSEAYGTFSASLGPLPSQEKHQGGVIALFAFGVMAVFLFAVTAQSDLSNGFEGSPPLTATLSSTSTTSFEDMFLDGINTTRLKEYLRAYADKPHMAGSAQDYVTASYTKNKFEEFGIRAEIKTYYPLLPVPRSIRVAITSPRRGTTELILNETTYKGDSCTTSEDVQTPFFAYSGSGNVTSPVVFVNTATEDDFAWLVSNDIKLKGKIALARYGINILSRKIRLSQDHGMAGVLVYSDPPLSQHEASLRSPAFPAGFSRPEGSVHRGSVQLVSLYPGDPLTPGFPSTANATYLSKSEVSDILPSIPATVIRADQAAYILASLGGDVAPTSWQLGNVKVEGGYRLGDDDETRVNLFVDMDDRIAPIWNVIGTIEGSEEPNKYVLVGNRRDAWVCGAIDPSSGSSTLLEIARGFGELLNKGWRPRRTIKFASWDGEEYGQLGSTEYAEENEQELLKNAVAYITVDATAGPFTQGLSTPLLANFLSDVSRSVPPNRFYGNESDMSLHDQWAAQIAQKKTPLSRQIGDEPLVYWIGSSTDYVPFYQHLGITSARLESYLDTYELGSFHSSLDSPKFLETFADPHYTTQVTTAKSWGLAIMRLALENLVPFDLSTFAGVLVGELDDVEATTRDKNLHVNFVKLRRAIDDLNTSIERVQSRVNSAKRSEQISKNEIALLNTKLMYFERQFLTNEGLPHRKWFRHLATGSNIYEGFFPVGFPGIADALFFEDGEVDIQSQVNLATEAVKRASAFLLE